MYALHCRPPSGGTHVRRPGFAERLHRRRRRGVAAMVAVMLLAVTAMTMAAAWTIIEHERGSWDRHRMAGQIWAGWVHALARAPEITATSAPDAPAGSDGPAVRVEEFVVRGSRLHLTSRDEAHGIGTPLVRPGDPEDTSLKTRTGEFATFSVNCLDFPAADERCVRTRDLTARTVRVRGNLGVHSEDGASGSGVTAHDTFARDLQALETPEGCHGCIGP